MEKKLAMVLNEYIDFSGNKVQMLSWCDDGSTHTFEVSDLCNTPEDAVIGKKLFDADDFIYAIRLGMDLRDKGYTDLQIIE